jgi:dTDP-D-glucose 4,6-dehydratase
LGWTAGTGLQEGIASTVEWYRATSTPNKRTGEMLGAATA